MRSGTRCDSAEPWRAGRYDGAGCAYQTHLKVNADEVVSSVGSHSDIMTGARRLLESNWREGRTAGGLEFGYTCPDPSKYPDQFFWDSCFHAVIWAGLGDGDRALTELAHVFRCQDESTGFVPHSRRSFSPNTRRDRIRRVRCCTTTFT